MGQDTVYGHRKSDKGADTDLMSLCSIFLTENFPNIESSLTAIFMLEINVSRAYLNPVKSL